MQNHFGARKVSMFATCVRSVNTGSSAQKLRGKFGVLPKIGNYLGWKGFLLAKQGELWSQSNYLCSYEGRYRLNGFLAVSFFGSAKTMK